MRRAKRSSFVRNDRGAVAPTIGLSLFALIAVGGIGFDYARMASLDSELQNAADQAALAAATQLDGTAGSVTRATTAASGLVSNITRFANDGGSSIIDVPTVLFYQNKDRSGGATTVDAEANFVEVTVGSRTANFALTPIVAAMSSGPLAASAYAGVGSSICNVPPVMMCNPNETLDPAFTTSNYVGAGIRLISNDGGGAYGPGVFGFLESGLGGGASGLKGALALPIPPGNCLKQSGVDVEPGQMQTLMNHLNTRFDLYTGDTNNTCGQDGSGCPPSTNSRKDVVMHQNGGGNPKCDFTTGGGQGWKQPEVNLRYAPDSDRLLTSAEIGNLAPMGYPRDTCHAHSVIGDCSAVPGNLLIGSKIWDRAAYYGTNSDIYPTPPASITLPDGTTTSTPTRYEVYQYELNTAGLLAAQSYGSGNDQRTAHGASFCVTPGIAPGGNNPDRRRLSVAVINCNAQSVASNSKDLVVQKWIDVFLTEPSLRRRNNAGTVITEASDVYVEVIEEVLAGGSGGVAGQVVARDVPYLIE